jgi:AcrR family transcriptional regulator
MAIEPRIRKSRKQDILDTFTTMVAERGYEAVSLREVAAELGMSKGTILHHFGTKDRMLEQLHEDYMKRRLAEAYAFQEQLHTPSARISAIVYQNMLAMRDDHAATVAFAREIVRFASEPTMQHVRELRSEYTHLVSSTVQQGMDDGIFAPGSAEMIALQIHGMINWSWTWFRPSGRWSPEEVAAAFVHTLLSGLQARAKPIDSTELDRVNEVVHNVMADIATHH